MGRKPKPTALKKVQGTYREDRAVENEPMPAIPDEVPTCPEWYPDDAKAFWAIAAPVFHRAGLLTEADVFFFGAGPLIYSFMVEAAKDLVDDGVRVDSARGDKDKVKNSAFQIFRDSYGMFSSWCASFGATPADRSKVSAAAQKDDEPEGLMSLAS